MPVNPSMLASLRVLTHLRYWIHALAASKDVILARRWFGGCRWIPRSSRGMTVAWSVIPRLSLSSRGLVCHPAAWSVIPRLGLSSRGLVCHPAA
ncbi:MAG: hypothetical protein HYW48_00675 [Deltaproteobacteria bacterium]|nr:hypothetical protein [Deltaproteobacteria bacterium]